MTEVAHIYTYYVDIFLLSYIYNYMYIYICSIAYDISHSTIIFRLSEVMAGDFAQMQSASVLFSVVDGAGQELRQGGGGAAAPGGDLDRGGGAVQCGRRVRLKRPKEAQ